MMRQNIHIGLGVPSELPSAPCISRHGKRILATTLGDMGCDSLWINTNPDCAIEGLPARFKPHGYFGVDVAKWFKELGLSDGLTLDEHKRQILQNVVRVYDFYFGVDIQSRSLFSIQRSPPNSQNLKVSTSPSLWTNKKSIQSGNSTTIEIRLPRLDLYRQIMSLTRPDRGGYYSSKNNAVKHAALFYKYQVEHINPSANRLLSLESRSENGWVWISSHEKQFIESTFGTFHVDAEETIHNKNVDKEESTQAAKVNSFERLSPAVGFAHEVKFHELTQHKGKDKTSAWLHSAANCQTLRQAKLLLNSVPKTTLLKCRAGAFEISCVPSDIDDVVNCAAQRNLYPLIQRSVKGLKDIVSDTIQYELITAYLSPDANQFLAFDRVALKHAGIVND